MQKFFPAKLSHLRKMIEFVKNQAQQIGFDSKTITRIEVASEEVFVNIINYAYPKGSYGEIKISCQAIDNRTALRIRVEDKGAAFNPKANVQKVNVNAPLEECTYGGYGIFLVMKVMDEVNYERKGNANILTMIIRIK